MPDIDRIVARDRRIAELARQWEEGEIDSATFAVLASGEHENRIVRIPGRAEGQGNTITGVGA
jgi:hypothetical protein